MKDLWKHKKAYKLRQAGMSYAEIGRQLLVSASWARMMVLRYESSLKYPEGTGNQK